MLKRKGAEKGGTRPAHDIIEHGVAGLERAVRGAELNKFGDLGAAGDGTGNSVR